MIKPGTWWRQLTLNETTLSKSLRLILRLCIPNQEALFPSTLNVLPRASDVGFYSQNRSHQPGFIRNIKSL